MFGPASGEQQLGSMPSTACLQAVRSFRCARAPLKIAHASPQTRSYAGLPDCRPVRLMNFNQNQLQISVCFS